MKNQTNTVENSKPLPSELVLYRSRSIFKIALSIWLIFVSAPILKAQNSLARQAAVELVREGDNHMRLGGWQQALISYSKAIETDPDYAVAYMKRGQINERILRTKEATEDYNMAIYLNPQIDIFYNQRARVKILSFDYFGAMEDMTAAIKINPVQNNYLKHQVDALIAFGLYEEALQRLDSIDLEIADDFYPSQRKGLIHILNGSINLADVELNKAYEIDQNNYLTLDLLGLIEMKKQNYVDAIEWFNLAIDADSTQATSYYNRAICYRFLGENQLALQDINTSLRLNSQQQKAFFSRALIKKEKGDLSGSIADYNTAIELDSTYENAIYNRSFSFKILGDFTTAEEDIDYLLETNDDVPEYWNMKGNLQVLHGDFQGAILSYKKAVGLNISYAEAYYNLGVAYLLLNQPSLACEYLHKSSQEGYVRARDLILNFCNN
jgi:tetratricopeptide (TPR) repeat protein